MKKVLLFLLIGSILSCTEKNPSTDSVFFSGEIVNPTSDFVVLFKNDIAVDSVKLDQDNHFSFEISNIEEGLHHFYHAPEQQYVYFEKGDSVLIRLNTVAFDESLVFSGSNEEVNNFMIDVYLNYEDEERLVNSYYKLAPEDFGHKIDSLRNQKLSELESLVVGEDLSENAFAMAKASIDYNSFLYKEKYPFYHKKKTGENTFHKLDANFYDHRKDLDFNNKDLAFFKPYYDFMIHHFGNLSYMKCATDCGTENHLAKKNHLHLNRHKMILIDSLVTEKDLKDNLFRNVAMDYLLKKHEANADCDAFIKKFESFSTNDLHKEEITRLYHGIKNLQANKELPDVFVEDYMGNEVSLKDIADNSKTVFYFWTASQKRHFRNVSKHVQKLQMSHPEYTFIGVNLRTGKNQWQTMVEERRLDTLSQYRSTDFERIQHTLIIDDLNKCVITKDTLIVDAFGNIYYSFKPNKKALVLN
ncbi:transaldolase [uncultured Croceitalea sp.]|uniref:transaldolase n=1 Tax=uncultured Croceitalea sp. TaxID=1798908 RepID=UPI0033060BA8